MLESQEAKKNFESRREKLLNPLKSRAELLLEIKNAMKKKGIEVQIDQENGVLTLENMNYFDKGRYTLSAKGKRQFTKIKEILAQNIICYSDLETLKKQDSRIENRSVWKSYYKQCPKSKNALIDSILIEGHADPTPIGPTLKRKENIQTNIDLAMKRSQTIFYFLTEYKESKAKGNYLYYLLNKRGNSLFGITSYGSLRPKHSGKSRDRSPPPPPPSPFSASKATDYDRVPSSEGHEDRRIDMRFIMAQPEKLKLELRKIIENRSHTEYAK